MKPALRLENSYAAAVVERLRELKTLGLSFTLAWQYAMADHPPNGFWQPRRRELWDPDTGAAHEDAPIEFLRRECEKAWNGEGRLSLEWIAERGLGQ